MYFLPNENTQNSIKLHQVQSVNNSSAISRYFEFDKGQRVSFLFPHSFAMLSVPFFWPTYFTFPSSPSYTPNPSLPPPLDILSHYTAWFGSLMCVHVVPLCKRPRLKLCGKSSASFLNTPSTVQGLMREGGGEKKNSGGNREEVRRKGVKERLKS